MIGRSTTSDHWWAWQTKAWSASEREPRAVLYQSVVINRSSSIGRHQSVVVTASEPGVPLGGTHVDVDEVLASDFGQWELDRSARR